VIRRSRIARNLLVVLGCLAVYVVCPVPGKDAPPVLSWLLFAAGVGAIGYTVAALVRRRRTAPEDNGVRLEALVALVYALVVFFALTYLSLATREDEFVDLENRVDAMYFTVSTVATVGFGDVHAVGSAARIAVTVQMAMDLLVLGIAARLVGPAIARRWAEKDSSGREGRDGPREQDDPGGPGDLDEQSDRGDQSDRDDRRPLTPEG
jgi:hypothetical protein